MKTIDTLDNNVFKHLITTIGALPTSFIDSMSYYEMIAWLVNYIKTEIVPTINDEAEAIKEIQHWIETLDLQQYVDEKLDEMAESGELAEIIAQYIQLNGVLAYKTVADMAAGENFVDGSICHTLGQDTFTDGLGAFYLIRTLLNTDTIDGFKLVALTNFPTLVAERVPENDIITPEMFGAVGDGATDDFTAMQAFLAYPANEKQLKAGAVYAIAGALTPVSNTVLEGNGATIKRLTPTINNRVMYIDAYGVTKENIVLKHIVFDGDKANATQSLTPLVNIYAGNEGVVKNITIENCTVQNVAGHGIGCYNDNSTTPVKTSFQNIAIKNTTVKTVDYVGIQQSKVCTTIDGCVISGTGAENITIDNGCDDCVVNNCQIAAYGQGGGIGMDESLGVKITNSYFDGTNNTAPAGYKNGITLNATTGVNYNTVIANNVFVNNDTGIRIGSADTTIATAAVNLSITGNTFNNSTSYSVFAQKSDSSTKVYARGNAYDKAFDFGGDVAVANVPKCYNIDYPFNLWNLVSAAQDFYLTKSYIYVYEGIVTYDLLVTATSASLPEGWRAIVNFGVTSKYNAELRIPTYATDLASLTGYKDAQIYQDMFTVYWVANEAIKTMIVKGSFPVA